MMKDSKRKKRDLLEEITYVVKCGYCNKHYVIYSPLDEESPIICTYCFTPSLRVMHWFVQDVVLVYADA